MKRFLFLFLLACSALHAQVNVAPLQMTRMQLFNATGQPLAGGCVNFFQAGTSTPQAIYSDNSGLFQLPNPLTLDAAGSADVWLTNTAYRIVTNTGTPGVACSVSLGTQLNVTDNKNIYAIINQGSNFVVANATSDPAGSPGELGYRTDIPCLRVFTSIWDCVVTLTATQTLSNKTINAAAFTGTQSGIVANSPTLNNPTINGQTIGSVSTTSNNPTNFTSFTNDTVTGTTLNTLTKLKVLAGGSTSIISTAGDTIGVEGITIAGAGISGSSMIQKSGQVLCAFDNSSTALDYIQISGSVNGDCHDTGSTACPTSGGQVIGRALTTTAGPANILIDLFGPEVRPCSGTAAAVNLTAQGANIASTPFFTPSANGFYRASCYIVLTQVATTSSTLPSCQVLWNDADTNVAETVTLLSIGGSGNTLGLFAPPGSPGSFPIYAKSGVAISYQTSSYATSGATPMQYSIRIRLEGPF